MLDKQIYIYSVDTGQFYSNHEKYLHDMNHKYRRERNYIHNKLPEIEQKLKALGYSDRDIKSLRKDSPESVSLLPGSDALLAEYRRWIRIAGHKLEKAKASKQMLLSLLSNKAAQNELTDGKDHIRTLRQHSINDTNVISVFASALSRSIGIKPDTLTDAFMVVQVYYFDIFKDISFYGFTYQGEKYRYFTSSAGQIRLKKAVFIKETVWKQIEKTVMCGLTLDKINAKGGNNVNKHLAYMALTNSATDEWEAFDIEKSIIIEDFETDVYGTFDFVDETDYSITRKTDAVPICHTDGAGMILPSVSSRNFMFRAPWIKGLLGVFDFKRFIEVHGCSPVVTDIYGHTHNIIEEDIQIIFTRSQFKMYKYYDSWEEYKTYFKQYHCSAGICNIEESRIKNTKINYQMLQTLTDITDEEIDLLTKKSVQRITNVCSSKETMMEILGITPYNSHMTPFQKAVKLYPALLADTYAKDVLREVKNSLLRKYRSGKLEITGKYTFILPDFYAACEYWFLHIEAPMGLLADQEVFCRLFPQYDKLDCLRSPHLYREHAIRRNMASPAYDARSDNPVYETRTESIGEWFITKALYTSTHDLISKLLQFDVDGDTSLVVADRDFIRIAERNMQGIVPLYYNMKKADATTLNHTTIYNGLIKAFTGGNIGLYSNDIAKIWNHDVFVHGTEKEQQEAIDVIKLLCMENNFCIDSAKTLYMPKRAKWFAPVVSKYTKTKLPAFFTYAKNKEPSQVAARNESFVNRIYDKIPDRPINTRGLKLGDIAYQNMMHNPDLLCSKEVSDLYDELNKKYRFMLYMQDESAGNLQYVACKIREAFSGLGYSDETIADMLVAYLYGKHKRYKQLLWFCYGHHIVNNLEKNLQIEKTKFIQCADCGEWLEIAATNNRTLRCACCQKQHARKSKTEKQRKYRSS